MIRLPPDFKEFLRLLNDHEVEYLVVGGYAVAHHGFPRATGDLDVWVNPSPENAGRLVTALREFGFGVTALSEDLFLTPDRVVRMGVPPVRIELLTTLSGVDFVECSQRRTIVPVGEIAAPFIGLADLRCNKEAAGRPKDRNDLENLPE